MHCMLEHHQWQALYISFYTFSAFHTGTGHSFPGTEADHSPPYIAEITVNLLHSMHLSLGYFCFSIYCIRNTGKYHESSYNCIFLSNSAFMEATSSICSQMGIYLGFVYCFTAHIKCFGCYNSIFPSGKNLAPIECVWTR
jgi:hypothetical protein